MIFLFMLDIDECKKLKDGRPEVCDNSDQICLNTPGTYQCVTKKSKKTFVIYIGKSAFSVKL